ncbi:MAG: D-alanyl-D-alanine carboxypeptidase, partial [Clostridia bacterium]|nr:D-alanyl-D-alanine carboxypeptidase [Clostridia bacterium]
MLCISFNYTVFAQPNNAEIAMELCTGAVLEEKNADVKLPMASTTKIMTALIIAEECDLDKVVTVPDCAAGVEGSSIYLKKGEEIDIRDLLYGLMLRSGNDSAAALAVIHSGSVEKFVTRMNKRAKEIGVKNTNFTNPSGLPDENHYTTARDLAKIACAAMKNEIFREIAGTKNYRGKYRSFANKNKMLYNYEGANGIKTGYTVKAGRCLVSSAERGGMDVVCVVLNCSEMYERSMQILDNCFKCFKLEEIGENNHFMCGDVLCKIKNNHKIVVKSDEEVSYKTEAYDKKQKDKNDGAEGKLKIYSQNSLIFESNLYS